MLVHVARQQNFHTVVRHHCDLIVCLRN